MYVYIHLTVNSSRCRDVMFLSEVTGPRFVHRLKRDAIAAVCPEPVYHHRSVGWISKLLKCYFLQEVVVAFVVRELGSV